MRQKIGTEFTADKKRDVGKKRNELGKDDFMRLMSAQLKYQDPVSPMKNEQMAAQLAQFSALEQMMNVNNNLEKMTAGQKPSEHMIAASLIGKRVTTDSTHFQLEKGGTPELAFELPADAANVTVAMVTARGEVVREIELGEMQKGAQSVRWDGKNSKAQEQPLGEYSYKVSAADKDGKPIEIKTDNTGLVSGVTFEGGKSLLLVDGKKIAIEGVGRIESDTQADLKTAPAKALTEGKQNSYSSAPVADKNSLPPGITPEKIKSMLASMGAQQITKEPEQDGQIPLPLWNPAGNMDPGAPEVNKN
ncbi:MAG: flagellar hook capping FlgD N-terminal domain-containing protein [Methylacidiphilaceae bacterium]|nr:flagellar hook capping FlgD N-terminal domain-containing protein [Candidatus Methylacidiphilaceae bacterium]